MKRRLLIGKGAAVTLWYCPKLCAHNPVSAAALRQPMDRWRHRLYR